MIIGLKFAWRPDDAAPQGKQPFKLVKIFTHFRRSSSQEIGAKLLNPHSLTFTMQFK
jgi:hypothetical protein